MAGASSRRLRPHSSGVTARARSSWAAASVAHRRRSAGVASRGANSSEASAGARAACMPAVSAPRSAAHLGRELDPDLARRQDPGGERLGDRLVGVGAVGDERLGDRDGRGAVTRRDHLREPGQRRHGRETRLLGQVGRQLQVRVQPGLEAAVRLEQDQLAEHDRRVGLVRAEIALGADRRCPVAIAGPGRQTRAAAGTAAPSAGMAAIARPSAIAPARARHAPSPGSAGRSGRPVRANEYRLEPPPASRVDAIARRCGAASSRTKASSSSMAVDRAALRAEPAGRGDALEVEARDRGRDLRSGQAWPVQA